MIPALTTPMTQVPQVGLSDITRARDRELDEARGLGGLTSLAVAGSGGGSGRRRRGGGEAGGGVQVPGAMLLARGPRPITDFRTSEKFKLKL